MNLSDLRRVTVKKQLRIRFALSNGMECVLNEHGVAQIPALRAAPNFNLEDEVAGAAQFLVEPAASEEKPKAAPRRYSRHEMETLMAALAAAGTSGETKHDEHED